MRTVLRPENQQSHHPQPILKPAPPAAEAEKQKACQRHAARRTPGILVFDTMEPPAQGEVPGAVVEIVSVAVPAEAPVTSAGLVAPKLSVGRNCAPLGADVITAVSATFPVNPPLGVTVIVDVLAVLRPASR